MKWSKNATRVKLLLWILAAIGPSVAASEWTKPEQQTLAPGALGQRLSDPQQSPQPSTGVINFWATWCAPCIKELPDLLALEQSLGDAGSLWLVNVGESAEQIERFAADNPTIQWRRDQITVGVGFAEMRALALRGLPSTFLIRDGQLIARADGVRNWADPSEQAWIKAQLTAPQ